MMGKISKDRLKGLVPMGKEISLTAERVSINGTTGQEERKIEKMDLRIYPLKVDEKAEIVGLFDSAKKSSDVSEQMKLNEDGTKKLLCYTLKKSIEGFEMADMETIPTDWYESIISKVFEFEGIDYAEMKKKAVTSNPLSK